MSFSFDLKATQRHARAGVMHTDHGDIPTPIFMPVGTAGSVKALDSNDISETHAPIILANTYHLHLRPGEDLVNEQGGVQKMMQWNKPMLTDSGGFQVFSLGAQLKQKQGGQVAKVREDDDVAMDPVVITDEGVEFTSHLDGSKHFFSPRKAIEIQRKIGADIIMAFDECTPDAADIEDANKALARTHAWARICKDEWEAGDRKSSQGHYQALFGIVQGAMHKDMRQKAAKEIVEMGFDGIALGGETIGYNMPGTMEVMGWVRELLPTDKPRYAMGLGRDPQDILDAIEVGFDMFDCVAPTRLARNGALYEGKLELVDGSYKVVSDFPKSRLPIGNSRFALDQQPIQHDCDCYTCKSGYTRAYLHHLFRSKELSYYRLSSIHNIRFMIRLCEQRRKAILAHKEKNQ